MSNDFSIVSRLYPLFADLAGRRVLVVGGGAVAERKTRALIDTGARVTVQAPGLNKGLRRLAGKGLIAWAQGGFKPETLDSVWLVVAASDDRDLNRRIAAAGEARRVFVNVVDDAALSSFHVPAIANRAPVQVAISSAGTSPALATAIRSHIEGLLDDSLGALASLLGDWRERIKTVLPDLSRRREFYRRVLGGRVAAALRAARPLAAEQALGRALKAESHTTGTASRGHVALVGAGPGDAGLVTLRGHRLLREADVILHDRLVSGEVLALARRDAELLPVGKRPGEGGNGQARIHALMLERAERGDFVVRLKGGDPFVFGRGGEELETLRAHDIPCEVVPGITAAIGCAAYAGVPLTHREHSHAVHWVTGHDEGTLERALGAGDKQTLVVYMGVARIDKLVGKLLARGLSPDLPFALIENGTRPEQRVVTGPLARLPALAQEHSVRAPALVIIGEVAAFARELAWFGDDFISPRSALRHVA